MKFLSSSTSSSSSTCTTTTSFDENFCNSKSATAGCIAGVLRRLLCSSSLPTYPSDHIMETSPLECDKIQELEEEEKKEAPITPASPGIVARLMGLDSMPVNNLGHTQMTPNSILRSRSMNSVDYWPECDRMQGRHRRVKTSLSFREPPTFLEREDEEFFILSFENGGESKELRSKGRKSEAALGELKQRRAERCRRKENRGENVLEQKKKEDQETRKKISIEKENVRRRVSEKPSQKISKVNDSTNNLRPTKMHAAAEIVKPTKHKEARDGSKLRKKKKKNYSAAKKVVPECSSEESSPVSVLDLDQFLVDLEVHTSEEDSRLMGSSSKRKLLPEQENCEQPSPLDTSSVISDDYRETKMIEGETHGSKKKDYKQSQNYVDMWGEICRLVGGEMMESNRICKEMWKVEDFEHIGADFGVQILDQLLNELVDLLVGPPMKIFEL
ncbi:hypothetical protein L1049_014376 [Liquidambar formosana]|uniref:DUF3741 domain-containing protein n=1 Tax=Liquidambar formosana TaxID=63359 RepID=A0AAP0RN66_LIQFO